MPAPPDPFITPSQLPRYGAPAAFVAQFQVRPVEIQISTAGALGAMGFEWRYRGEVNWSGEILSSNLPPWSYAIDDAFLQLTFATHAYVGTTVYTVDEAGNVSGGAELTATRYDLRTNGCSAVSAEILTLVEDAVPDGATITSWTDDWRRHASAMVHAFLKRARGATPGGAGNAGDEGVWHAETIARRFFIGIGENGLPTAIATTGGPTAQPLLAAFPASDDPRGW